MDLGTGGFSHKLQEIEINKPQSILITGCAGFIGSNLLEFFLSKGLNVRGLDNFSTGNKQNIEQAIAVNKKNFEFIEGDIRDYDCCLNSTKGIDIVFHQAALGSVQRSLEKPLDSNSVNVAGTMNMLKASLDNKISRFIYASSSSIYGDSKELPKHEGMPPNPKSIYAVTKLTAEYYCSLFYSLYGLRTISLRYFNVFGRRQNPNSIYSAVIPRFVEHILKSQPPKIFGDGNQSRDFTHIDNVVYANFLAMGSENNDIFGHYFNIACEESINLNQIIKFIENFVGHKTKPVFLPERKGDIKHSLSSINEAQCKLGFQPIVSFNDGLTITIKWYLENNIAQSNY